MNCPSDPAFGAQKVDCDFTHGACNPIKEADGTTIEYGKDGAVFAIKKAGDAPTVESSNYIFFGHIDVDLKIAPGNCIVTSVVLQSDDLDEIDLEWLGGQPNKVQTNYFRRGDDGTYDRGRTHDVSDATGTFHTYSIDWTPDAIHWSIDGTVIRTVTKAEADPKFPQTPMRVKLGTWTPGPSASPGTIQWAGNGNLADFSQSPFNAYYRSVSIVDYAGGSAATDKSVKEYVYGDQSGSKDSIRVQ